MGWKYLTQYFCFDILTYRTYILIIIKENMFDSNLPECGLTFEAVKLEWGDTMNKSEYMVIDLKSFYASVECVERGLDPFTTNLVVADPEREEGTICLAITPAMKALGVHSGLSIYKGNRCIKDGNQLGNDHTSAGSRVIRQDCEPFHSNS